MIIVSSIVLVINTAENIELTIPIIRVKAKPWIGPDATAPNTKAAMNVVKFASTIATNAFSYPLCTASCGLFWAFISSLILSNIITFASTDIPIVSIIPAIPGSVNVPAASLQDSKSLKINEPGEVAKVFVDAGADSRNPIIVYCGGGVAATLNAFLLYQLGYNNSAVIDYLLVSNLPRHQSVWGLHTD